MRRLETAAEHAEARDEASLEAVLVVSPPPALKILAQNGDAPALFGRAPHELREASLTDLLGRATQAKVRGLTETAIATGEAHGRLQGPRGTPLEDVHLQLNALRENGDRVASLAVRVREIHAVETAEQRIARLESDCEELREEFQQFAYAASHDLQEPLRMITSYLQLLQRRYAGRLDEDADEFISFATDGAARLREMISGLIAFSRVTTQAGPIRTVHSAAALARARNLLADEIEKADARITHGPLPVVQADREQMTLLFRLLLANAIEFCGAEPPRIQVRAETKDGMCRFSIQDNGIGIDPQHRESVFGAFERLNPREEHAGVGMGLTIARRIVTRHGGRLWVESEPGAGCTFCFTVPAAKQEDRA